MAGIPVSYLPILLMTVLGIVVVAVALSLSRFITPPRRTREKLTRYESAEVSIGSGRGPIDVQYYLYVLVFLVLDIEAVFLLPFVLEFQALGQTAVIEMVVFIGLLLFGWAYAIRKGALRWQGS